MARTFVFTVLFICEESANGMELELKSRWRKVAWRLVLSKGVRIC